MNMEHKSAVAQVIQAHLEKCPYSVGEIAILAGCPSFEMFEGFVRGDLRVPLDKALPLAQALGCDKRQFFVLVLASWFGREFVEALEEVLAGDAASTAEQGWINYLREFYRENVPELTPSLRRRLRLLVSLPS